MKSEMAGRKKKVKRKTEGFHAFVIEQSGQNGAPLRPCGL